MVKQSAPAYVAPHVSIDVVLLTLIDGVLNVVLVRRAAAPAQDELALPGGYVHTNEDGDLRDTVTRVLRDKIGIRIAHLEQIGTFGNASRDPRGWSLSVLYCAFAPPAQLISETAAETAILVPVTDVPTLPFDHSDLLARALERVRNKSSYSTLPALLMPPQFTLAELQTVYEHVMGVSLPRVTFRRRMEESGLIKPVEGQFRAGAQRPAQLYKLKSRQLALLENTIVGQ